MADKQKIWDNYVIIGEVRKSAGKKLVVSASTLNGFRYVNIHEYYRRKTDHEWMRGAKVVSIPLKSTTDSGVSWLHPLESLLPLLKTAGDEAAKIELADENNEVWMDTKKSKRGGNSNV